MRIRPRSVVMVAMAALATAFPQIAPSTLAPAAMAKTSAAAQSWYGTYEYTESIPRNGGITATVDYTVTLSDAGCKLDMQGLQTDTHIRCTAQIQGKSLRIGFISYADGDVINQYGTQVYRPGQTLMTFTRTPSGLVTKFQGVTRSGGDRPNGKYFRKRPN